MGFSASSLRQSAIMMHHFFTCLVISSQVGLATGATVTVDYYSDAMCTVESQWGNSHTRAESDCHDSVDTAASMIYTQISCGLDGQGSYIEEKFTGPHCDATSFTSTTASYTTGVCFGPVQSGEYGKARCSANGRLYEISDASALSGTSPLRGATIASIAALSMVILGGSVLHRVIRRREARAETEQMPLAAAEQKMIDGKVDAEN